MKHQDPPEMALWFFILLPLFAVGESQTTNPINQTDLQVAIADMRTGSYHGFVILLKILNSSANSLQDGEITFLMPHDEELSKVALRLDHLRDFILLHSIPMALPLAHLLHFPNGTLVPSGLEHERLRITNSGRSGLMVNNARITTPNVCPNSQIIRCHGISAALKLSRVDSSLLSRRLDRPNTRPMDSQNTQKKGRPSSTHDRKDPALY